jgi:catalase
MYEYWANHPQSLHQMTILMSDRGIPRSWRHMHGFGSHTLGFWNAAGERFWVKWHLKTDQGIQCVTDDEAATLPAHGAQQDLVDAIERGDYPSWTVQLQILTEEVARSFPHNPFDLTKVWPHELAPLREIGKLTLNRNVDNYFAETEQAAFAPSNLVPGICASPDKMLQARLLAYQDAQRYRVGVNHNQLPVNAPRCPVHHYQRDGAMAGTADNQGGGINFFPNDREDEPKPQGEYAPPPLPLLEEAWVQSHSQDDENYYEQAGNLYRVMSDRQKTQLAATIADGLSQADRSVQNRILGFLHEADPDYAQRVREAIGPAAPVSARARSSSFSSTVL